MIHSRGHTKMQLYRKEKEILYVRAYIHWQPLKSLAAPASSWCLKKFTKKLLGHEKNKQNS